MNAYWVDEETVWAAADPITARLSYQEQVGEASQEPRLLSEAQLDQSIPDADEDGEPTGGTTTLRHQLTQMTSPGFLACTL